MKDDIKLAPFFNKKLKQIKMKDKEKLYTDAILNSYPNATNIREPELYGSLHNVRLADIGDTTRVFKFSDEDLVLKNCKVSYLYKIRHIPAPIITVGDHNNLAFEDYVAIEGITLFDAIKKGIGHEQIQQIYRDIVDLIMKMERLYPDVLGSGKMHNAYEIAGAHATRTHGITIGQLAKLLVFLANLNGKDMGLYHFDLGPKNIIVSNDGKFKSLIDMDSVGCCSKNFAFGMLAARYNQIGMDMRDLFKYYDSQNNCPLNSEAIIKIARIRQKSLKKR